ncbi:LacI family transcriptional regulator [Georgenia soli]|uniref:LacI family transcriptional regulator n=1 Tax=Georgenia soli TaxID=638953 RepID=A0A2A9F3A4_9MICO|nr:LacI family DNA-binding transcriptional regulator [Georgenia soli]PFG44990.1 LacI family transcriptional regulator [Georgenia soli]
MAKKPTMMDVSRAAGLSVWTVSRALGDGDGVSAQSREAVLRAARELGYVPNRAAQELRKNTRRTVTVLTASTSNYYYIDLMRGVQRTLRSSGRTAMVADLAAEGAYTVQVEDATVQNVIEHRTAGVISTLTLSPHNAELLQTWDIPVVFVDSAPPAGVAGAASVTTDNYAASRDVAEHLAAHGYTEWLLLMYPSRWTTRAPRERGMREAAARLGANLVVIDSENDPRSAATAFASYLDREGTRPPRAVIAGNNPLLQGVLEVLRGRRLNVPEDVALVAFDEFAWAPLLAPPLTVLDENASNIGDLAASTLTRLIERQIQAEREGERPVPVYLPEDRQEVAATLTIRQSCGC